MQWNRMKARRTPDLFIRMRMMMKKMRRRKCEMRGTSNGVSHIDCSSFSLTDTSLLRLELQTRQDGTLPWGSSRQIPRCGCEVRWVPGEPK